jgi:hypothetical protein
MDELEIITPEWAKVKRAELGFTQAEFWSPAMVSKGMACGYENGTLNIPKRVKRMMFDHYYNEHDRREKVVRAAIQLKQAAELIEAARKGLMTVTTEQ